MSAVGAPPQQRQAQAIQDIPHRQDAQPPRGQLQRQGDPLQTVSQLLQLRAVLKRGAALAGPRHQQRLRVRRRQGPHRHPVRPLEPQHLPGGEHQPGQRGQPPPALHHRDQVCDLLKVVQHDDRRAAAHEGVRLCPRFPPGSRSAVGGCQPSAVFRSAPSTSSARSARASSSMSSKRPSGEVTGSAAPRAPARRAPPRTPADAAGAGSGRRRSPGRQGPGCPRRSPETPA